MAIFIGRRPETAFTRVPNDWARDPKLSFKAKGLLTYLLSHQDGYRLTVEQVVAEATDGKSAVYSAIKELVERGYLERVQRRGERGKVGEVDYHVADAPGETASGFSASGKPESGAELGEQEETAGGTASRFSASGLSACGESTTKKTRVLEDQVLEDEKTISLSAPEAEAPAPGAAAPQSEREIVSASLEEPKNGNPIHRMLLDAGCPANRLDEVREDLIRRHQPRSIAWWRTVADNEDLAALVDEALEALIPAQPGMTNTAYKASLSGERTCDHGEPGGNLPRASDGWMHCASCRMRAGWVAKDKQGRTEERGSDRGRSTSVARARQALDLGDELDRENGHGRCAPRQIHEKHRTFQNPPIEAYYGEL